MPTQTAQTAKHRMNMRQSNATKRPDLVDVSPKAERVQATRGARPVGKKKDPEAQAAAEKKRKSSMVRVGELEEDMAMQVELDTRTPRPHSIAAVCELHRTESYRMLPLNAHRDPAPEVDTPVIDAPTDTANEYMPGQTPTEENVSNVEEESEEEAPPKKKAKRVKAPSIRDSINTYKANEHVVKGVEVKKAPGQPKANSKSTRDIPMVSQGSMHLDDTNL